MGDDLSPALQKLLDDRVDAAIEAMKPYIEEYKAEWEAEIMERGACDRPDMNGLAGLAHEPISFLKPGSWVTVWDEAGNEHTEQVPESHVTTYTPLGQHTDVIYPAWNRKERRARKARGEIC